MPSLGAFLLAKAIEEAERQRDETRKTVALLGTPGLKLTAEGQEAFAAGILIATHRLARIDRLIQKLRRRRNLMTAGFRLRRFAPRRPAPPS